MQYETTKKKQIIQNVPDIKKSQNNKQMSYLIGPLNGFFLLQQDTCTGTCTNTISTEIVN